MKRPPTAPKLLARRLQRIALPLRALYLGRPGLITKLLAIVAFFSIGIV
ncbi:MAG TPA: hypothetical protein VMD06_07580 [Steroidobacteraceae bacterium]|nr:hypothetical protein [Steroidobacteraceae bacterium]